MGNDISSKLSLTMHNVCTGMIVQVHAFIISAVIHNITTAFGKRNVNGTPAKKYKY